MLRKKKREKFKKQYMLHYLHNFINRDPLLEQPGTQGNKSHCNRNTSKANCVDKNLNTYSMFVFSSCREEREGPPLRAFDL